MFCFLATNKAYMVTKNAWNLVHVPQKSPGFLTKVAHVRADTHLYLLPHISTKKANYLII